MYVHYVLQVSSLALALIYPYSISLDNSNADSSQPRLFNHPLHFPHRLTTALQHCIAVPPSTAMYSIPRGMGGMRGLAVPPSTEPVTGDALQNRWLDKAEAVGI